MKTATLPLWIAALFLCFSAGAYGPIPPNIPTNDPYAAAGYLKATLYSGVDPTGATDSTAGLQQALNDGYNYGLAVLLPAGTYLVSNTLLREQVWQQTACGELLTFTPEGINKSPMLVGEPGATRPLIKLANSASGFNNPSSPKPVIHFKNNNPAKSGWMGDPDCGFGFVVRGIDIHLGSGNSGAVGISMASAQYSTLEDVKITATGAYAGVRGTPSTNVVVNVEVEGGQYGIMPYTCCGISLIGIKLRNQTVAGLMLDDDYSAVMMTGFEIEQSTAVPIMNDTYRSHTAELALLDGVIRITGAGTQPAISNLNGHTMWMSNVYVITPGLIAANHNGATVAGGGTRRVDEYSYTNNQVWTPSGSSITHRAYTLINGTTSQSQISVINTAATVPTDLVSRHVYGRIPWFTDPGVVDVTTLGAVGDGVTDSTAAIQSAINQSDLVFLPRGEYVISSTLQLNANTKLFGVHGMRSNLTAPNWNPASQFHPFIRTPDTATGSPYLGDIRLLLPATLAKSYLSGIDWRAGRNSLVRQVNVDAKWEYCAPGQAPGCYSSAGRKLVHIRNNGGGRWYGLNLLQKGGRLYHADFRGLFVDGTTQPLTIYGPNPEKQRSAPFFEINGAENVRVLGGLKSEGLTYAIVNSNNVLFAAHTGNSDFYPMMKVVGSTNVEIPVFTEYGRQGSSNGTIVEPGYPYILYDAVNAVGISGDDRVSLFKLGDFDASPFEPVNEFSACVAPAAVTVNGNASDWVDVPSFAVPYTKAVTGTPTSDADSSATFRVQWDNTNLYVLVEVRDDVVTGTAVGLWNNDSVELYINAGNESGTTYDSNDHQLTVDWRGFLTGTNSGTITFTRAAATTAQGFTVEYAIPWSQLVSPGTAGRVIGLDIAVNDNDAPDGVRDSQIVWNGNGTGWQNPSQFDQLTLGARPCGSLSACLSNGTTTIDGNAADWGSIVATPLPYTKAVAGGGGTPGSDADSSASFRWKWDSNNLYALVEVRDDAIAGTGNVWVNDAVELYLDGGHEHSSTYDTNDYQLSVDWRNVLAGTRSNQLTFNRAVTSTAQGFNVEYSVPWSALRTPAAGAVVGIDVAVNDDDGGDGVRDSQIVWHGNGTGWSDPRQLGDLVLDAALCH